MEHSTTILDRNRTSCMQKLHSFSSAPLPKKTHFFYRLFELSVSSLINANDSTYNLKTFCFYRWGKGVSHYQNSKSNTVFSMNLCEQTKTKMSISRHSIFVIRSLNNYFHWVLWLSYKKKWKIKKTLHINQMNTIFPKTNKKKSSLWTYGK